VLAEGHARAGAEVSRSPHTGPSSFAVPDEYHHHMSMRAKPSRIRRFFRWWGDAISHAGMMVGASKAFTHHPDPSGSEKYVGTAMLLNQTRHLEGEPRADTAEDADSR
jgi:hypothetical protein